MLPLLTPWLPCLALRRLQPIAWAAFPARPPRGALHSGPQVVERVRVDHQVHQVAVQEGGGEQAPPLARHNQSVDLGKGGTTQEDEARMRHQARGAAAVRGHSVVFPICLACCSACCILAEPPLPPHSTYTGTGIPTSGSAHHNLRTLMPHTVMSSRVSSCSPNSRALPTSSTSVARLAGSPNSPGRWPDRPPPPPPPRGDSAPLQQH